MGLVHHAGHILDRKTPGQVQVRQAALLRLLLRPGASAAVADDHKMDVRVRAQQTGRLDNDLDRLGAADTAGEKH